MKTQTTLSLFFCLFLCYTTFSQEYYSKDSTKNQAQKAPLMQIKLKDGTVIKGIIKSQNQQAVKIETQNMGTVDVNMQTVTSITSTTENSSTDELYISPNQYFYSNSAFMLKEKTIELQNIYGLYNNFEFGVSKNFSLSVGGILIPTFTYLPILFGAKYGTPIGKDIGVFVTSKNVAILGVGSGFVGTITPGITLGNPLNNISVAASWAYATASGGAVISPAPSFSLSGSFKVGEKAAFVTDNVLLSGFDSSTLVYSLGLKTFGKRQSFGFGVVGYTGGRNYNYAFPYIRANFNLSKR
jgi:hypothetical protein